jgi:hypothetical protein
VRWDLIREPDYMEHISYVSGDGRGSLNSTCDISQESIIDFILLYLASLIRLIQNQGDDSESFCSRLSSVVIYPVAFQHPPPVDHDYYHMRR